MRITDVINHKGSSVVTAGPDQDLAHLVRLLTEHNIGAVVIAGPDGSVAGIAGERDVVRALAAYGPEALSHPISDVMAAEVRTVAMDDDLTDVAASMTELRVRHMPVLVDGQLAAIVSIGDIVKEPHRRPAERDGVPDQLRARATCPHVTCLSDRIDG